MKLVRELERLELDCQSIVPIQKGGSWLWRLYIDGVAVAMDNIRHIAIKSPWGLISFGMENETGCNSVSFRETAEGGAVIIPFVLIKDGVVVEQFDRNCQILVEVVQQLRPKCGGLVWNVPRGFVDVGDKEHLSAAGRELMQEASIVGTKIVELPGNPVNPNSSFFETGVNGGLRFFATQLLNEHVTREESGWQLIQPAIDDVERVNGARLITITEAIELNDGPTIIATARLWLWLNAGSSVSI
ncbi:hypothetical protein EOM71_02475 [Candidatus Falkowbacteria bacterium]|nr:hypothetical protein [Candidatus Falkowbacteria bacterium]